MSDKYIFVIKRFSFLVIWVVFVLFCFAQCYAGMSHYKDGISAHGFIGFNEEIALNTILSSIFFSIFYFIFKKLTIYIRVVSLSLVYGLMCFLVNHEMFVARVSGWSTFSFSEEIFATINHSIIALPISVIIFGFACVFIFMKQKVQ